MINVWILVVGYVIIGIIFSMHYANTRVKNYNDKSEYDEDDGMVGSFLFYKLFGGWCEKHGVDYGFVMFTYSILFWPTYLLTITYGIISFICEVLYEFMVWYLPNLYKLLKGIKNSIKMK